MAVMQSANLDLLRTYAVVCVAVSHLLLQGIGIPAAYRDFVHNLGVGGVLFFFVHTSLVLFYSMERSQQGGRVIDFYIRRFFRIYPLCWVAIGLVLLTGLTDKAENIVGHGKLGILANFALLQNLPRDHSVLGPLWSLPWEVQMYLILPFLFLLIVNKTSASVVRRK